MVKVLTVILTQTCGMSYNPYWIVCNEKSYIIQRDCWGRNRAGNQKDVYTLKLIIPWRQWVIFFFNM